jgi:hypothetical protein
MSEVFLKGLPLAKVYFTLIVLPIWKAQVWFLSQKTEVWIVEHEYRNPMTRTSCTFT